MRAPERDEAGGRQGVQQLLVQQMHLPQVGLSRVAGHAGAVLDGDVKMRIALHTQPRQQSDARLRRFGKDMPGGEMHGDYFAHGVDVGGSGK